MIGNKQAFDAWKADIQSKFEYSYGKKPILAQI